MKPAVIEIGQLRHRVIWQQKLAPVRAKDRNGQPTVPFRDMGTFWAGLFP